MSGECEVCGYHTLECSCETKAPERIWVNPYYLDNPSKTLACNLGTSDSTRALSSDTPYIRADLLDAVKAERDAARAFRDALWQPIDTAPKEPVAEGASFGPMILLGSIYGHRAIGYWGRGRGNQRYGWVNPHDHMVMDYWGAFTHWQPLPGIPEGDSDA